MNDHLLTTLYFIQNNNKPDGQPKPVSVLGHLVLVLDGNPVLQAILLLIIILMSLIVF